MADRIIRLLSYLLGAVGTLLVLGAVGAPDDPQYMPSLKQVILLTTMGFMLIWFARRMYVAAEPRHIFLGKQ